MKVGIKTRRGREFWKESLREQLESGQSVAAYCVDKGLEQATFYAWRKRLGDGVSGSSGVAFTPIVVKEPVIEGTELQLPGGLILRFSGLVPVDYLRQLSAAYVVV